MNRRVLLIAVVAAVVVTGLWYVTMWSPANDALGAAHKRTEAANQQAADLGLRVRSLEAARKDMPVKQAQLDRLRAAVPDGPVLDEMIATVNAAALASGVELLGLAPAPPGGTAGGAGAGAGSSVKVVGGPSQLTVSIAVQGNYFQTMDFMNRLNGASRLVVFDSVGLTGTTDKSGKVTSTMSARMFMQPMAAGVK